MNVGGSKRLDNQDVDFGGKELMKQIGRRMSDISEGGFVRVEGTGLDKVAGVASYGVRLY